MFVVLLLALTLVPMIELMLLLQFHGLVSYAIGPVPGFFVTIGTVLATGAIGAFLARQQGMKTLLAIQDALSKGQLPANDVVDGALILVGGALLLTPGFATDLFGLSLLAPFTRKYIREALKAWLWKQIQSGRVYVKTTGMWPPWKMEPPKVTVVETKPDPQGQGPQS
jgi:UPF0716 protein FxsA